MFEWIKRKAIGRNVIIGTAGAILVQKICFSIPGVYRKFEFRQSFATNPCTRAYEEPLAKTGVEKITTSAGLTEVELTDQKLCNSYRAADRKLGYEMELTESEKTLIARL